MTAWLRERLGAGLAFQFGTPVGRRWVSI